MAITVVVNELTLVHKGSGGTVTSGPPDVCKSPSVPVPYVNFALSSNLQNGSVTVFADGGNSCAIKDCYFLPSQGDEPGVGGGVVSGVNMGKAKFINYSMDTFIEGRNACRLTDPMSMNGNAPNTTAPAELQQNLGVKNYDILCKIFCWCDAGNKGQDFVKQVPGIEA